MKKIVALMVVGLFIGVIVVPSISGNFEEKQNIENKQIKVSFSKPTFEEEGTNITINIEEANNLLIKAGKPLLPMYTHQIVLPLGTIVKSIKVTPKNIVKKDLYKQIAISPVAIKVGSQVKINNVQASEIYNQYPENWYDYNIGSGIINKQGRKIIVKSNLYPIRYSYAQSTIEFSQNMIINVEYIQPSEPISTDEIYKFIIITANQFSNQFNNLVNHKNSRGLSTKLVTLNEIDSSYYFPVEGRDDAEKIKYFIKNAIDNWGTTDVLLVGGSDEFPTRNTHIKVSDDDSEIFVSDLYYADVYDEEMNFCSWDSNENNVFAEYDWGTSSNYDDMDLFPDIRIGRVACTSPEEATTIVDKIINYETNEAYTKNWFNDIVVIGGDTVPEKHGDKSGIDEGEYLNQAVLDVMDGFIPDKIWDSNKRLSGIIPSGVDNIENGINSGCGFVCWSGHGAPKVWTTYPHNGDRQTLPTPWGTYYNSHIMDLTNGDKLPIVTCGGCSLGKFQKNDNCFAWAYLSNPNGGGIASVGASGLGYVYLGKHVTQGLVEGFMLNLFEAYAYGAITFGEMWSWAINEYISGRLDGGDYKTLTELIPFGDPTLAIRDESIPPEKPQKPSGPTSGKAGEELTFYSSTTDDDGDKVYYLFDWGDAEFSEWIGPKESGEQVTAGHIWTSEGDFSIRVKAKDVHGVQSEWSEPLSISMPKNKMFYQINILFERLFQRFTFFEKILNQILPLRFD